MAVLGLDIGTSCGFAVDDSGQLSSGVWNLKPRVGSCDTTSELTLFRRLEKIRETYGKIDLVAYEEVVAHGRKEEAKVKCNMCGAWIKASRQASNTYAAQLYGSLRGIIRLWADFHSIPMSGVAVKTLKKFATGSGRAKKEDMIAWAQMRWREQNVKSHDQADALHVLDWAMVEVLKRKPKPVIMQRTEK